MAIDATDNISFMTPVTVDASRLGSSSISPEDASPAWSSATTYAAGDRVHSATTHRVYESLQGSNLNKDPTLPENQVNAQGDGTWWFDVEPTNRWAMFDSTVSTQSTAPTEIFAGVYPGAFNSIALFGLDGDHINIKAYKDGTLAEIYYEYDADLEDSAPPDYYEYFFDPFKPQTQLLITGLPPYASAYVVTTVTKTTGDVKIGLLAFGTLSSLGAPLRGASVEPVDYSYVSTDAFGKTAIKKRHNATGMSITGKLDVASASVVLDNVKNVLGTPCVVIGSEKENYLGLTVFGLMSARVVYAPDNAVDEVNINITVKGLV